VYSLRLHCKSEEAELIISELWEWEPLAISESDEGGATFIVAGFDTVDNREILLQHFAPYTAEWQQDETDWMAVVQKTWPGRVVGQRLFLAPHWSHQPTPPGRLRIVHNPSMASGTGEHPCTQLALEALEEQVTPGGRVLDIGTGSGLLAIAARLLGASVAIGLDTDEQALRVARENFSYNDIDAALAAGSADAITDGWADVTVSNISGTVLLSILDDLLRVTRTAGMLILTGFEQGEGRPFLAMFPDAVVSTRDGWSCLAIRTF
jgi:ribosomal protein L11 methyltransferase